MKGGKGGRGRQHAPAKTVNKAPPRPSVKKGAPKRDWGAVEADDFGDAKPKLPTHPAGKGKRV